MFDTIGFMDPVRFAIALPDDLDVLCRLETAVAVQSDPPVSMSRSGEAVTAFVCPTGEMMLLRRVMHALEAAGPDWQSLVQPAQ